MISLTDLDVKRKGCRAGVMHDISLLDVGRILRRKKINFTRRVSSWSQVVLKLQFKFSINSSYYTGHGTVKSQ